MVHGKPCHRLAREDSGLCSLHLRRGKITWMPWEGDYRPHLKEVWTRLCEANMALRKVRSEANINKYSGGPEHPNALVASEVCLEMITELMDQIQTWREAV